VTITQPVVDRHETIGEAMLPSVGGSVAGLSARRHADRPAALSSRVATMAAAMQKASPTVSLTVSADRHGGRSSYCHPDRPAPTPDEPYENRWHGDGGKHQITVGQIAAGAVRKCLTNVDVDQ
jgi:hypothetical protein